LEDRFRIAVHVRRQHDVALDLGLDPANVVGLGARERGGIGGDGLLLRVARGLLALGLRLEVRGFARLPLACFRALLLFFLFLPLRLALSVLLLFSLLSLRRLLRLASLFPLRLACDLRLLIGLLLFRLGLGDRFRGRRFGRGLRRRLGRRRRGRRRFGLGL